RFAPEDLQLFRAASYDANPLHVSPAYSRQTAYGEPVVFGILGALASAGFLRERPGQVLREVELEFRNPLFAGIAYPVDVRAETEEEAIVLIHAAGRVMAKSHYGFRSHAGSDAKPKTSRWPAARETAAVWKKTELRAGTEVAGEYAASLDSLEKLMA